MTLSYEGGYVNNAKDPGGITNLGVTQQSWKEFVHQTNPSAVVDDRVMRGLTAAMVSPFYLKRFWNVVRGYALPRGVDRVVFDYAVNSGTTRAVTALQIAVGVKADGGMGVATIAAVSAYVRAKTGKALVAAVCSSRLAFLHTAKNRKTGALLWPTFGKGWKRRVDAICATAAQEAQ